MVVRKPVDDTEARLALSHTVAGILDDAAGAGVDRSDIETNERIADLFAAAEFETVTSKVAGETVTLRRLVLTGEWEVVKTA